MKEPKPWVKPVLELGPVLIFFLVFILKRGETTVIAGQEYSAFILATLVFIPALALATLIQWRLTGKLAPMQIATLVLVIVFGGLSVWLNDPRFFKMKPTMIYLLFGGILGFGLLRGQSYLRTVLDAQVPLKHEGWMILTRRLTAFFFLLAVLNEVIWRTMSTETWVYFKTFGLTAAVFLFFMTQGSLFKRYGLEQESE